MSDFLWQSFVTLLVIIDPFMIVPVFIGLTRTDSSLQRERIARKTCVIATILLVFFAVAGDRLLDVMGISEPAFRIAGGFLLLLAGVEMVMAKSTGSRTPTNAEEKEAIDRDDISVFPLAIPLIAGPGSMTSIVVLMREAEHQGATIEMGVILIAIFVLFLTYIAMRMAERLMKLLGVTGMNVLTRVFGVIVAALATQYIVHGVTAVVKGMQ
ncbi:MAG: MarC family protein [Proteobacteria bacterium]|nr:MarC family protein [Pseudomonadota bacterium]